MVARELLMFFFAIFFGLAKEGKKPEKPAIMNPRKTYNIGKNLNFVISFSLVFFCVKRLPGMTSEVRLE